MGDSEFRSRLGSVKFYRTSLQAEIRRSGPLHEDQAYHNGGMVNTSEGLMDQLALVAVKANNVKSKSGEQSQAVAWRKAVLCSRSVVVLQGKGRGVQSLTNGISTAKET